MSSLLTFNSNLISNEYFTCTLNDNNSNNYCSTSYHKISYTGVEELTHVNEVEAAQLMHQPNEAYSRMECIDLIEKSKNLP